MRLMVALAIAVAVPAKTGMAQDWDRALLLHDAPQPVSEIRFVDGDARTIGLRDFRGKLVLLNLWATWCGPCRREMPTLDRLQARLGGQGFVVVPLSIDRAGIEPVRQFYAEIGVARLGTYLDSSGKAARDLGIFGLPTTLLIDRDGRELGRLVGPAEWDSAKMIALLERLIAAPSNANAKEKPP